MDILWNEVQAALQLCSDTNLPIEGELLHYHVRLDGRHQILEDAVLLPAMLLQSWTSLSPENPKSGCQKVLVKVPLATWYCTAKHCSVLRVFHCPLTRPEGLPVIDATWGTAVVMATPFLREDSCLQAVELFAGGFCGWGQSLRVLQGLGCNVRTRWLVDHSEECFQSARLVHGGLTLVKTASELRKAALHSAEPVFVLGDFKSSGGTAFLLKPRVAFGAHLRLVPRGVMPPLVQGCSARTANFPCTLPP